MKRHQPPVHLEGKLPAESSELPSDTTDVEFKVSDRRYWAHDAEAEANSQTEAAPRKPTVVDEYRQRAEAAESKLHEYIEAFKEREREQDQVRARLQRDIDRKVELRFGHLVAELIETMDDLDLSLSHLERSTQDASVVQGVKLARDRFLAILERNGVQSIALNDTPFDPNEAEALRVDPVNDPAQDGTVTETLRAGYRLGERVIRPAQVAVGRYRSEDA